MKKAKLESIADFDALPEDEWVEVDGGVKVHLVFDNLVTIDGVQYVPLPPSGLGRLKSAVMDRIRTRRSRGLTERAQ